MKKEQLINELGTSGTTIINGYIEEDYRSDLQGAEGYKAYDEMRKSDAQIYATLLSMELPIRQTKWTISGGDEIIRDFIEDNLFHKLENIWDDLLREILLMLPFGFSVFEKVYTIENDKILLKKLGLRKASTILKWQTEKGTPGITQNVNNTDDNINGNFNISIPLDKLVIFTYRQEGLNYEGTSVLRSCYKHWYIKDKLYKFDAVRHERQSVGIPVIFLPQNASDLDKEEAGRIVRNIRSTEQTGIVMPGPRSQGWDFEFADTKANQSTNLFESIKHHNREISKNILAQFLELGDTQSGSRSLSEDQSNLFLLGLSAIANYIRDVFNKKIIPELVNLNFNNTKEYPKLHFEKLGETDYNSIVNNLNILAGGGLINIDNGLKKYIRELLELPEEDKIKKEEEKKDKEEDKIEAHECNCNDEEIFSNKYFQELNEIIDKKFIIDLHKKGES